MLARSGGWLATHDDDDVAISEAVRMAARVDDQGGEVRGRGEGWRMDVVVEERRERA